jgi:hypothetical protein
MSEDKQNPAANPQPASPPPRPPRGPNATTGFSGDDDSDRNSGLPLRKNPARIYLPPKPVAEPTIKLPAIATAAKVPAGAPKKQPWWKFW